MKDQVKNKIFIVTAFFVLVGAFLIRFINLEQTPLGFHADEASFYINAISLAQTGMDEDGNRFPLALASIIDPKPALYSYFQIPFVVLIENPVVAARLASVFLGIFSILAVYIFMKEISNKSVAIFSSILLTLSPWHIIVSRATHEVITSFLFLVISLLFLIKFLKSKKHFILFLSLFTVNSFLSMYLYHSAKVVLPLLVFVLLLTHFGSVETLHNGFKNIQKNLKQIIAVVILTIFAGVTSLLIQESSSRISAVSFLSDPTTQQQLLEQIYGIGSQLPTQVTRVIYNKPTAYLSSVVTEYLNYFSPQFLFLKGGFPTRYIVADSGLLYLIELPLILLGIFVAIRSKDKNFIFFMSVLFLSPIPASLTTQETPSIIRSFPMILALVYFSALGLEKLWNIKNTVIKLGLFTLIAGIFVWQVTYFSVQYHIQSAHIKPWYRNSPYTQIAQEVAQISNNYTTVVVTNDLRPLYAYFVMYDLISIEQLQANPYARNSQEYHLGKFNFNRGVCELGVIKPGTLYIAEVGCRKNNEGWNTLELVTAISYNDGLEVYELLQVTQ